MKNKAAKKVVGVFVLICLLITAIPSAAFASEPESHQTETAAETAGEPEAPQEPEEAAPPISEDTEVPSVQEPDSQDVPSDPATEGQIPSVQETVSRDTPSREETDASMEDTVPSQEASEGASDIPTVEESTGGASETDGILPEETESLSEEEITAQETEIFVPEETESVPEGIPEGMTVHGATLCIASGKHFSTDAIADAAALVSVDSLENRGTVTAGAAVIDLAVENGQEARIEGGTFTGEVVNYGTIADGVFKGRVLNHSVILNGTFTGEVTNRGRIMDGTFDGTTTNYNLIHGGRFANLVEAGETVVLEDGTDVSSDGNALLLKAGFTATTDELAAEARQLGVSRIENRGTIVAGAHPLDLDVHCVNEGRIQSGIFNGTITGYINIKGGTFNGNVENVYGFISGGTFHKRVNSEEYYLVIEGGNFYGDVNGRSIGIGAGKFHGTVDIYTVGGISGGDFYGAVYLRNGGLMGGVFHGDVVNYNGSVIEETQKDIKLVFSPGATFTNYGTVYTGEYPCKVINEGEIRGGSFTGEVENTGTGTIRGGSYRNAVYNSGVIAGGEFDKTVTNDKSGSISGGLFHEAVVNKGRVSGGTFEKGLRSEDGGISLPDGFGLSDGGGTVVVKAGYAVSTDQLAETLKWTNAASVRIQGSVRGGDAVILVPVINTGSIRNASFAGEVTNRGTISHAAFGAYVENSGTIYYGSFSAAAENSGTIEDSVLKPL